MKLLTSCSRGSDVCNTLSRVRAARRATPDRPAAFPFSYMDPSKYVDVIDGYNVRNVSISRFAPVGAPFLLLPLGRVRCMLVSGVAGCPWHRALPNQHLHPRQMYAPYHMHALPPLASNRHEMVCSPRAEASIQI